MDTLIENIDLSTVPFADIALAKFDPQNYEIGQSSLTSVDLAQVIGTTHPDYAGKTWGELKPAPGTLSNRDPANIEVTYQPLKRASRNCQLLERNPDYYLSKDEKEHWSFYRVGNQYFISSGNNRTIVGRYFFHLNGLSAVVHGVVVVDATPKPISDKKQASPKFLSKIRSWFNFRAKAAPNNSFKPTPLRGAA